MLPRPPSVRHQKIPPSDVGSSPPIVDAPPIVDIGVGIDTSRYGHYAAFLDADLQTAAPDLEVLESAAGYAKLRQRFADLVAKHGRVHFRVRLDAAGLYADNLLAALDALAIERADFTLSCGDTQRNKNYRVAVFGHQKSDPIEARACARFALTERPPSDNAVSLEFLALRQVAGRLQAVVRHRTRLVNQLHQLLARAFPELAVRVKDITTGGVGRSVARSGGVGWCRTWPAGPERRCVEANRPWCE